ncbi:two-component regulator propeller domain-containing protein [Dyadobacter sp. CY347]|uniref:ligand-binding sensor domain-containing protein n=1 Tax=Dyadobacter sp. CY347 TaxID=2909336 RepID=UPI001F1DF687|nr:two-component regulator propeller domain-containing protein [Dyadobacter sp. CY347]MCF2490300.1 hypothetical protein [Dyadobacter sp. CY347]
MLYKICLFLCLLPGLVSGQFIFQNLRTNDGLSSKVIRSLYKDKDGYLWIGTIKGLNRFDGAIVRQFGIETGLRDLYINAIQPLGKDDLILGTRQGVKVFNRKEGAYVNDQRFEQLNTIDIYNIYLDGFSRLWFLTQSGIYIFLNGKLVNLETMVPDAEILRNAKYGLSILVWDQARGGFWMGGPEIYFIDCRNKTIYHKSNNPNRVPIFDVSNVFAIAVDAEGNLWYESRNTKSLNFWNQKTNKMISYSELDGERIYEGCNKIFIDQKGRVWISTWAFAAYLKEPGEPIRKIPYSQNRKYSIGYGFFWAAIEDVEGNVWLGTLNGISKVQANAPVQAIYQLPSFKYFLHTGFAHANSIVVENSTIMAAKEDGVVRFNMKTRMHQRYIPDNGPDLVKNKFFMSVKSEGIWWFAGLDGIHFLRPGGEKLEPLLTGAFRFKAKPANLIFVDSVGNIWF